MVRADKKVNLMILLDMTFLKMKIMKAIKRKKDTIPVTMRKMMSNLFTICITTDMMGTRISNMALSMMPMASKFAERRPQIQLVKNPQKEALRRSKTKKKRKRKKKTVHPRSRPSCRSDRRMLERTRDIQDW